MSSTRNRDLLISIASVVTPESAQLEENVAKALEMLDGCYEFYELLLVDNGSPFNFHSRVMAITKRYSNVRVIRLSRTYSREVAIAAALDHCIGDYVVVMNLAVDPLDLVPPLITRAAAGYDSVIAENEIRPSIFLERTLVRPVYRMASRLLGFTLGSDESYFRVFSRRLVNSIIKIRSKNRYLSCLNGMVGFQQSAVVYQQESPDQHTGSIRRLFRSLAAVSGMLVSNSAAPLRFAAILGLIGELV